MDYRSKAIVTGSVAVAPVAIGFAGLKWALKRQFIGDSRTWSPNLLGLLLSKYT